MIFRMKISINVFNKLVVLVLQVMASLLKVLKIASLQNLLYISRKKWGMKLFFCAMSITFFYKLILSLLLMGVSRHAQEIQNNKFAVPLQYLKKELSYEVDVLHVGKHESFLQVDSIIFDGFSQTCPKYPGKFALSLWHLKKEVRNEARDLTALAGSNIALTIYYTSNVLQTLTIFFS